MENLLLKIDEERNWKGKNAEENWSRFKVKEEVLLKIVEFIFNEGIRVEQFWH